jgi:hypothetical protein
MFFRLLLLAILVMTNAGWSSPISPSYVNGLTADTSPATGDLLIIRDYQTGQMRKVDVSSLPTGTGGSGGGLSSSAIDTSAEIRAIVTDETGGGALVFATSPVLTTPNIGSATGSVTGNAGTATALAANGANASSGNAILGVDASGAAEGAFDVIEPTEINTSAKIAAITSDETGSGALVFATSPTFTTPNIGTATGSITGNAATATSATTASTATALAANGANCSSGSYPLGVDASGAAESCGTTITGNAGTATALAANGANASSGNAILGVDASGAAEGAFDVIVPTEIDTSAEIAAIVGDETGTGSLVFGTSPTFTTPNIGTATGSVSGNAGTATALAANGTNCAAGDAPVGVDASGNAEGCATILATTAINTSAKIAAIVSDETGSGALVFGTSPNFTTPNIGTATGSITGNSGTATALAANGSNASAGNAILGVDASGNAEGAFAVTRPTDIDTSAEIKALVTDETGSGALAFSTSPTFTTPNLGVATATSFNNSDGDITNVGVIYLDTISSDAGTTVSMGNDLSFGTKHIVSTNSSYISIEQPDAATTVRIGMYRTGTVVPVISPDSVTNNNGVKFSVVNGHVALADAGVAIPPAGSGDVVGPSSATADSLAIYNGTTGKLLKNSLCTIAADGTLTCPAFISTTPGPLTNSGGEGLDASVVLAADEADDSADTFTVQSTATNNTLQFINGTSSVPRMTMTSTGIVGIGTTAPSEILSIIDNASNARNIGIYDSSKTLNAQIYAAGDATNQALYLNMPNATGTDSTSDSWLTMRFNGSANKLHFGDNGTVATVQSDHPINFTSHAAGTPDTSVAPSMTIKETKVGIGTTGPSVELHVVGNARVTGLVSCNTIDTDSSGNMSCGTDATGSGGGTATFVWSPQIQSPHLPIANPARLDASNAQWALLYDASTAQIATWDTLMYPYSGSALNGKIIYSMASATSGTVEFDLKIGCITAGTDAQDIDTKTLGSANVFTGTVPATAGYTGLITVTSLSQDSCASGDTLIMSVNRDATDAVNDTATGNAELREILLYE